MRLRAIRHCIPFAAICCGALALCSITSAGTSRYSFGDPVCIAAKLDSTQERLFVSYFDDDAVVEIEMSTMTELRRFTVASPGMIAIAPDDQYLYVTSSGWPQSSVVRVRVVDGEMDALSVSGDIGDVSIDESGDWLWIVHRTYPIPGQLADLQEALRDYPDSGYLTKIATSTFSIAATINTLPLPMSVWYSAYSNKVFVLHENEMKREDESDPQGSVIGTWWADTLNWAGCTVGGMHESIRFRPTMACEWSADGQFLALPNPTECSPNYSLRVIDCEDNSIAFDLQIVDGYGKILNIKHVRKVPGSNILWAITNSERTGLGYSYCLARVDTETRDYQIFDGPEAVSAIGYGDVSDDCDTIFMPLIYTGEIVVWDAPNTPPVCFLSVVTPMPYIGPAPAEIEFDATGSYDPDPCDELTYEWDFDGDGIYGEPVDDSYTGDPDNPTHSYTASYHGPVLLRLSDNHGSAMTCTVYVDVDII